VASCSCAAALSLLFFFNLDFLVSIFYAKCLREAFM